MRSIAIATLFQWACFRELFRLIYIANDFPWICVHTTMNHKVSSTGKICTLIYYLLMVSQWKRTKYEEPK